MSKHCFIVLELYLFKGILFYTVSALTILVMIFNVRFMFFVTAASFVLCKTVGGDTERRHEGEKRKERKRWENWKQAAAAAAAEQEETTRKT